MCIKQKALKYPHFSNALKRKEARGNLWTNKWKNSG